MRKIYFGAGPAKLPEEVLRQASEAVINYEGSGLSILEIPHRGKAFAAILEESKSLVRELCGLSNDYEVLWLQGGGRLQFAMAPANLLGKEETAGYIDSGHWAHDALETAKLYGNVSVLSSSREKKYLSLPEWPSNVAESLAYVHITTNNTIYGTQWQEIPQVPVPIAADMSSDIFGVKRDYSRFGLFYAVAQKNIGPAGVTLVVIHRDLLLKQKRPLPASLSYRDNAAADSLLNTAPVFAIYTCLLNLRLLHSKGLENQLSENLTKAAMLYAALEESTHFHCPVSAGSRSLMNVIFRLNDESHTAGFAQHFSAAGITGIEGHRSAGGYRASLYDAVTVQDVSQLVQSIKTFQPQ